AARLEHREEVNAIVSDWSGGLPREEVVARCAEAGVPCGAINSIADIFAEEQFHARGDLLTVQDERAGEVTVPA
ncbi:MAG: CoA transferase, partial [Gammaproteobacteria bacterium]|nr:CoA transferase [Gammaproteobacteria bacterium]